MTKYLHTMIRVTDPEATIRFFELIGLREMRRVSSEQGRFTLIFLAAPDQEGVAEVELTYNWPAEDGSYEKYTGGRNFGHLAFEVENIYETCQRLMDAGVTIIRGCDVDNGDATVCRGDRNAFGDWHLLCNGWRQG